LIGYGKMGKTIEKIAEHRGHEIKWKIDVDQETKLTDLDATVDVAIEFTRPESAVENIRYCLDKKIPIVSGTTGWLKEFDKVRQLCLAREAAFFYASNYSIGVNIFFALNKYLAQIMDSFSGYEASIKEIHHTQKLDAPSGTAITLAEGILEKLSRKNSWINQLGSADQLSIISERIDDDPGTHIISYESDIDYLKIEHHAKSRQGFALGAVLAAEWIVGKTGCFGMDDMLSL
ncbi:MAG: 4-hydroxy-tetrahydrodipicolinate reductase, partial [Saprospiraceae bacterium]|nr:4-hydroxy-tetrahydrodipicolinate reductase [Saprospiraceae bacterium]